MLRQLSQAYELVPTIEFLDRLVPGP
jgi:hypothetical protein